MEGPLLKPLRHRQGGFILITLYLLLTVLLIHAGALVAFSAASLKAAQRSHNLMRTHYLAEAAVDQAVVSLRDVTFAARVSDSGADPEIAYTALGSGGYETDVDPVPGRPGLYRIRGSGYFPDRQVGSQGFQQDIVGSYVRVSAVSSLPVGLFGDRGVSLNGSVRVDSYDSRTGVVRSTRHGLIGTNNGASSSITINGSVAVYGDVLSGPGAPRQAIRINGSSVVTGRMGPADSATSLPPVTEPVGATELRISGHQTVTLPGGTYHYSRITINGGGRLSFTGPAVVYTKEMTLNGSGMATASNLPENLKINVVGTGRVLLNGAVSFYGVIYAPESEVTLNGGNRLFGAVTGDRVSLNGSVELWYDEALKAGGAGSGNQVQMISWQEESML